MKSTLVSLSLRAVLVTLAAALVLPGVALPHDPEFTANFNRGRCTFTTVGGNPYFPLWPGYSLLLQGQEQDDEGDLVEISARMTILHQTELVDGVLTRVVEEREEEDGELVEVSRNFMAMCRETGDVWYFGEDVDDFEDGELVGHAGAWRAGVNGAEPGIIMPGSPLVGARYFQEIAPGVALDQGEIISTDAQVTVPVGNFTNVLEVVDTSVLDPEAMDQKFFAPGIGNIVDEVLQLVEITPPPCLPDPSTLCLNNGRFRVRAEWEIEDGDEGPGMAMLPTNDSGEFWFFSPHNTELIVKVLDACNLPGFNNFWVFAGGLTDVEVTLTVTDTQTGQTRTYENPLGTPFQPIQDTDAFATCP